jgi:hypothetical protein
VKKSIDQTILAQVPENPETDWSYCLRNKISQDTKEIKHQTLV